ncbi:hypothetical protein KSZ_05700 [Dictyobacter formicarum]|uniref:Secreted protein n=1 Tax=Dictyobacter formicarum TaxID=2778368 RepID=A0ABQ3V9P5_9CHLR|nr:hypothetical protein KSZ_05700 [Dictyobacter formicarum]
MKTLSSCRPRAFLYYLVGVRLATGIRESHLCAKTAWNRRGRGTPGYGETLPDETAYDSQTYHEEVGYDGTIVRLSCVG